MKGIIKEAVEYLHAGIAPNKEHRPILADAILVLSAELSRTKAALDAAVEGLEAYADKGSWWPASHSITDESRQHMDVLFSEAVHTNTHGWKAAVEALDKIAKIREGRKGHANERAA